ncbi:MAG: hypothetical protein OIN88_13980 [Candidatus Methanoperedens sp.]|nr:hypothetical protein [Candidatus Methanoperedens sp.]MCZ7360728.1 hypothetical protein [Candidatus Methanoperedens sp.]
MKITNIFCLFMVAMVGILSIANTVDAAKPPDAEKKASSEMPLMSESDNNIQSDIRGLPQLTPENGQVIFSEFF